MELTDKSKEADLLLKIYEIYSSESMVDAFTWFFKDFHASKLEDFEESYPLGSQERKTFYRVANFFDLLGTFLEREYMEKQLIIDFCPDDVKSFWKISKKVILQMRKKWNDPTLYTGLEFLNDEIEKWQKSLSAKTPKKPE
jgi:hypothetical protein